MPWESAVDQGRCTLSRLGPPANVGWAKCNAIGSNEVLAATRDWKGQVWLRRQAWVVP